MKEEDIFPTPPEAPMPTLGQRMIHSPYFWWLGALFMMALFVMWLPSQCSFDAMSLPQEQNRDFDKEPFVDLETELQQQEDGKWYTTKDGEIYSGVGMTFHPNGKRKTRVVYVDGLPVGLIEEWDLNGSSVGPRFKGEFKAD